MNRALKIAGWVLLGLGVAVLLALGFGLLLRELWNWLMPAVFGLPMITYWQAVGLFVLAHLLVKGHYESSGGAHGARKAEAPPSKEINAEDLAQNVARRVKTMLDTERGTAGNQARPESGV